ncbi:hypothetical protein Tco_0328328, partial [Tanacetum coccineum]
MTRGGYESPVYHDNFQQFQQTASVGNFVQNGNSGYRPPNLANHTHPPGFPSNQGKPSNQGNIPHQMVPYQSPPQNSQIVLANQLDNFKKTTEGSMQAMRNHITNLKAEIRSEVQATLQNQINSLKDPRVPLILCFKTFSNPLFEKQDDFPSRNDESILKEEVHEEAFKSYLNPLFEDDEEIISNEASSILSPKIDVKTIMSFFAPIGNCVRKWASSEVEKDNVEVNHEVFKSDSENSLGIHDNEEEEIAFLDGLLEDENFFEMNDKKVESFESKTKEDFETKIEPEKKKELQVFHPDIEILDHLETTSYVGSDYVFYEDFNLVDMIFPMNIQGKIFDPGITFHGKSFEKDAFKDKSSKELAPSKALLTLDVFDPLHPPLMTFNVTKAFFGFKFSILKLFSKKLFEPGIKNAL